MKEKAFRQDNLVLLAKGLIKVKSTRLRRVGGDIVVRQGTRSYPNGTFTSTLLGSNDSKNTGLNGLEYQYNEKLAGIKRLSG